MPAFASVSWVAPPISGFAGEAYWENIHTSMGDQYANTLQSLMPSWMMYVGFALLFVGGILGALLGHKMLKKHFERAGIV